MRTRLEIMNELHTLTNQMLSQRNDVDFLVQGVEDRQALMEEFNAADADLSEQEEAEIKGLARDILQKDKIIDAALQGFQAQAKGKLTQARSQSRVLGYAESAISSSGSYMDYRK